MPDTAQCFDFSLPVMRVPTHMRVNLVSMFDRSMMHPNRVVQTEVSFFMASVGDAGLPGRLVGRSSRGLKYLERRLFTPSSVGKQVQRRSSRGAWSRPGRKKICG